MKELNRSTDQCESDDETLIEEFFKNGNRASFDNLVRRYQVQAVNYLYRLGRDFELAEDLAQTAFLTLYQKASLFNPIYKFRPWFYKILTNLYRYEMRKRKHFLYRSLEATQEFPNGTTTSFGEIISGKTISPQDELEKKEKRAYIEKLIASLPEKQKIALTLYIYNERNYKDIARTLGCSVGTVKSRIHYALRNIKEKITKAV